jgi:hypothetical protein
MGGLHFVSNFGLEAAGVAVLALIGARPLSVARRSGFLELLLCTPVPVDHIVQGYWHGRWQTMRVPLLVSVLAPAGLYIGLVGVQAASRDLVYWMVLYLGPQVVMNALRAVAACWLGMRFGLTSRTLAGAVGWVLLLVLVLPWLLGLILSMAISVWFGAVAGSRAPAWISLIVLTPSLLNLAWLVGWIRWSRTRLRSRFREWVAGEMRPQTSFREWFAHAIRVARNRA